MDPLIKKTYEAAFKGQSYAFATIVESTGQGTPCKQGAKMVILSDGSVFGTIGGGQNEKEAIEACQKAIKTRKTSLLTYDNFGKKGQPICGGQIKVFIEPFAGQKHLIICGAGHIALPLSVIAKMLNFKVTVIDNRKMFANKTRFPHVDKILVGNHVKRLEGIALTENSYVVIVTHGHEFDFDCLKSVIKSKTKYIGVISSRTKRQIFFKRLTAHGVSKNLLKKIKIPVGIDIGAQTPEEIALSIASEIVAENNKECLNSEKFKTKAKN